MEITYIRLIGQRRLSRNSLRFVNYLCKCYLYLEKKVLSPCVIVQEKISISIFQIYIIVMSDVFKGDRLSLQMKVTEDIYRGRMPLQTSSGFQKPVG